MDGSGYGIGGGHGGYGGGSDVVDYATGSHYGSYLKPVEEGSMGGGSNGGAGGNTINLDVSNLFHMDGYLLANGADATGSNSGGGSGGSIKAHFLIFSGHGNMSTEGGNGHGYGYGGSGGRMSVTCDWTLEYAGFYLAYGGYSGDNRASDEGNGAAGTTFLASNPRGPEFAEYNNETGTPEKINEDEVLLINNDNRNHELATVIETDDGSDEIELKEINALNHVTLMFNGVTEIIAHVLSGDKTGRMFVKTGQRMWVEYKESQVTYSIAPVSYYTQENSTVVLPSDVDLLGTRVVLKGWIHQIQNLTIADSAVVSC